jgi:kynureninase
MAPLLASLQIFDAAGMRRLRDKSSSLTGYLRHAIERRLAEAVEIITPAEPGAHGCQLSLRIRRPPDEARRCHEQLLAAGVFGDWREPDVLRLAPAPLYNSYGDVAAAVDRLAGVLLP